MIVERIEAANLAPTTYRTARRLLDLANPQTGSASLSHDQLRTVAGTDADGTARRHLIELQAAGIIHYRRNSDVQIWFADWAADNVISGDHGRSAVITGDHDVSNSRGGDHDVITRDHKHVITGDHDVSKLITSRANCSRRDQLPHTHANAPDLEGRKEDPITPDHVLPSIPPSPAENERSLAMLRAVKVSPAEAKALAATHPFERIRHCVAAWWMNRKSMGGRLENEPGVVVFWLKNWGGKQEPKAYDERAWQREDLYLAHRTPAEIAADAAQPPAPPEPAMVAESQPARASPYLDDDPGWLAVAADPGAAGELAGLVEVAEVDGVPVYRLRARDPAMAQMLDNRMAPRLQKVIKGAVGYPVLVRIIGDEDGKQT